VHRQCKPALRSIAFRGASKARPAPGVVDALSAADAVIICPSNPWVSIDPILAIREIAGALDPRRTVAISPIIGGHTIKGPAAKMFMEMGIEPSAAAVARHYGPAIGSFVLDRLDVNLQASIQETGIRTLVCDTIMETVPARRRLAQEVLEFVRAVRP
jgi:LPPG:FO 2-phospho-L-lactate transferase